MYAHYLLIFFWIALLVQACFAAFFFVGYKKVFRSPAPGAYASPGISVIVCAKNEASSLEKNLPVILNQHYSGHFEVVVVNDGSTDETARVLDYLSAQYENLRVVNIGADERRDLKGKKFALVRGAGAAQFDCFLLTDADCFPAGEKWLALMAAQFTAGKELVAGFGDYMGAPGMLNALTRWETRHTFLLYTTLANAGLPYMAVGRNMGCTRRILESVSRSERWNRTLSGDDDLLVNLGAHKGNFGIVCNPDAFTYSPARTSWREWVWQKQRHLSTGKYYKTQVKWALAAYAMSHAVLWITFILCCNSPFWSWISLPMLGRCGAYWYIWGQAYRALRKDSAEHLMRPAILFPLFDAGWMLYNFAFSPYIFWKNKQQWKRS